MIDIEVDINSKNGDLFVYKDHTTGKYLKIKTDGVVDINSADKFSKYTFIVNANPSRKWTFERVNYFDEIKKIRKEKILKLNNA